MKPTVSLELRAYILDGLMRHVYKSGKIESEDEMHRLVGELMREFREKNHAKNNEAE